MSDDRDSLAEFVGGDVRGARSLRSALEALRDSPAVSPALQAQVAAVLAGRSSMRELAQDPALRELAERGVDQLREELSQMSPEDRADLVRRSAALAAGTDPQR